MKKVRIQGPTVPKLKVDYLIDTPTVSIKSGHIASCDTLSTKGAIYNDISFSDLYTYAPASDSQPYGQDNNQTTCQGQ